MSEVGWVLFAVMVVIALVIGTLFEYIERSRLEERVNRLRENRDFFSDQYNKAIARSFDDRNEIDRLKKDNDELLVKLARASTVLRAITT
jgi:uncharacterized membrane-anchored protein YhcB (DUF1043 family)